MKKYNLKKDHIEIKKQIKLWEICLDHLVGVMTCKGYMTKDQRLKVASYLENMADEMMSINI